MDVETPARRPYRSAGRARAAAATRDAIVAAFAAQLGEPRHAGARPARAPRPTPACRCAPSTSTSPTSPSGWRRWPTGPSTASVPSSPSPASTTSPPTSGVPTPRPRAEPAVARALRVASAGRRASSPATPRPAPGGRRPPHRHRRAAGADHPGHRRRRPAGVAPRPASPCKRFRAAGRRRRRSRGPFGGRDWSPTCAPGAEHGKMLRVADTERTIDVVVEIPRGSRNKYEYDHETHVIQPRPAAVLGHGVSGRLRVHPRHPRRGRRPARRARPPRRPDLPGLLGVSRPVGVFWMEDDKGPDAKIICVPGRRPPVGRRAGDRGRPRTAAGRDRALLRRLQDARARQALEHPRLRGHRRRPGPRSRPPSPGTSRTDQRPTGSTRRSRRRRRSPGRRARRWAGRRPGPTIGGRTGASTATGTARTHAADGGAPAASRAPASDRSEAGDEVGPAPVGLDGARSHDPGVEEPRDHPAQAVEEQAAVEQQQAVLAEPQRAVQPPPRPRVARDHDVAEVVAP